LRRAHHQALEETYFEHAYLRNASRFPLSKEVFGTVRGDTVHLKTIGGLREVQAILPRPTDGLLLSARASGGDSAPA